MFPEIEGEQPHVKLEFFNSTVSGLMAVSIRVILETSLLGVNLVLDQPYLSNPDSFTNSNFVVITSAAIISTSHGSFGKDSGYQR